MNAWFRSLRLTLLLFWREWKQLNIFSLVVVNDTDDGLCVEEQQKCKTTHTDTHKHASTLNRNAFLVQYLHSSYLESLSHTESTIWLEYVHVWGVIVIAVGFWQIFLFCTLSAHVLTLFTHIWWMSMSIVFVLNRSLWMSSVEMETTIISISIFILKFLLWREILSLKPKAFMKKFRNNCNISTSKYCVQYCT